MDPAAQLKLVELTTRFGREVAQDARRCEALLRDLCGEQYRREVNVLVCAVRDGVAAELAESTGTPKAVLFTRLTARLHNNYGIDETFARWSVESWALALGMATRSEIITLASGVKKSAAEQECQVADKPKKAAEGIPISINLGGEVNLDLVWIPPGEFMMGSPDGENGRYSDEGPQHRVWIRKGFLMGKYAVTQAQWEQVMGNNPSKYKNAGPSAPVEQVSWNDCQVYIEKLNQRPEIKSQQVQASLPTEAQGEYACRAGTTTRYNSGGEEKALDQTGWYNCKSGNTTHPAGQKTVNAWGLYDMHGNVCEWCQDWYGKYDGGAVTDPIGPSSGSFRVLRGGSWGGMDRVCRSAYRDRYVPEAACGSFGFRVVCCR